MSLERHFSRICTSLRIPWAYSLTSMASLGLSKRADSPNAAMSQERLSPIVSVPACFQLISSRSRSRRSVAPSCLGFSVRCRWAQPERDMTGLHRFIDDREQILAQLAQVNFIPQRCAERLQRFSSIILATIETSVDDGLNASSQGLEESRNGEGRDHKGDGRLGELAGEQAYQRAETDDQTNVDQSQQDCERAIDQRTIDHNINIPQPRAQNGNGEKNGDNGEGHAEKGVQTSQHGVILD